MTIEQNNHIIYGRPVEFRPQGFPLYHIYYQDEFFGTIMDWSKWSVSEDEYKYNFVSFTGTGFKGTTRHPDLDSAKAAASTFIKMIVDVKFWFQI